MHLNAQTQFPNYDRLIHSCLLLFVFFLAACAGPKYQQDYRPATTFDRLHTYDWRKVSADIPGVDRQHLQRLADQQLTNQGFARAETKPDMLIDLTLITRVSTGASTGIGLSVGIPLGQRSSLGVGGGKVTPNEKREGVIFVDISDAQSQELLWRGSAEAVPLKYFTLQNENRLAEIFAHLLKQFPPR